MLHLGSEIFHECNQRLENYYTVKGLPDTFPKTTQAKKKQFLLTACFNIT